MLTFVLAGLLLVEPIAVPIPGGEGGIGFDDLLFAPSLHRFVIPGGRTGSVFLLDPATRRLESVGGLGKQASWSGGHGQGVTSADVGPGVLFAADRTTRKLFAFPLGGKGPVAEAALEGGPDYVRWVEPTREVWVTEPGKKVLEIFRFEAGSHPTLVRAGRIEVPDGPESLVVDASHGRAFTSTWHDQTLAVSLRERAVVGRWTNGCKGARGLAADVERGLLLVGCEEGAVTVVDIGHGGRVAGRARTGEGVDVIAYDPVARRVYVPAADAGRLEVFEVGADGALRALWQAPTAPGAHCVAADGTGQVLVCDPKGGRVLLFDDGKTPR